MNLIIGILIATINTVKINLNIQPMEHTFNNTSGQPGSRLGFHYFQDHDHYRTEDLLFWVPRLKTFGTAWLVLNGEISRAIPEDFIKGLKKEKIEPIIHFRLGLSHPIAIDQLEPLLSVYSKWGVRNIIFFENPNQQISWGNQRWSQPNLIEAFVDQFLPLAKTTINLGMTPFFPAMIPGGQYWDTVFLQQSLEEIKKRDAVEILSKLGISAYGWSWGKSLDWGAGGIERWPKTKPYRIPLDSQDQRGLRTYEWYQSVARKVIGKNCPIILLQMGLVNEPVFSTSSNDINKNNINNAETNIKLIQLLNNENVLELESSSELLQPISDMVICGNIWLMSCNSLQQKYKGYAWWNEDGNLAEMPASVLRSIQASSKNVSERDGILMFGKSAGDNHPISRYLFFASLEDFLQNEHRWDVQEYLMRYQPTIGFSLNEAAQAAIVDIGSDENQVPESVLEALRECGCSVRRLQETHKKIINEDYGVELADFPYEKDINYA